MKSRSNEVASQRRTNSVSMASRTSAAWRSRASASATRSSASTSWSSATRGVTPAAAAWRATCAAVMGRPLTIATASAALAFEGDAVGTVTAPSQPAGAPAGRRPSGPIASALQLGCGGPGGSLAANLSREAGGMTRRSTTAATSPSPSTSTSAGVGRRARGGERAGRSYNVGRGVE